MERLKKITGELPAGDLERAQRYSGKGVTETARAAVKQFASRQAQLELLKYRAKVRFELTMDEMKYDGE